MPSPEHIPIQRESYLPSNVRGIRNWLILPNNFSGQWTNIFKGLLNFSLLPPNAFLVDSVIEGKNLSRLRNVSPFLTSHSGKAILTLVCHLVIDNLNPSAIVEQFKLHWH